MSSRSPLELDPQCPIRTGDPCTLCQLGASGPEDCGLVYLVMTDDELRDGLLETRRRMWNHSSSKVIPAKCQEFTGGRAGDRTGRRR